MPDTSYDGDQLQGLRVKLWAAGEPAALRVNFRGVQIPLYTAFHEPAWILAATVRAPTTVAGDKVACFVDCFVPLIAMLNRWMMTLAPKERLAPYTMSLLVFRRALMAAKVSRNKRFKLSFPMLISCHSGRRRDRPWLWTRACLDQGFRIHAAWNSTRSAVRASSGSC